MFLFYVKMVTMYSLYVLELNNISIMNTVINKITQEETNPRLLWHHRLGHMRDNRIMRLKTNEILSLLGYKPYPTSESCL